MFSDVLRKLRKEKGLSQSALADILNMSQQAIGKWETNHATPDFDTLVQLADYFNVSTDYLLGNDKANSETNAIAAAISNNQHLKNLFQIANISTPNNINAVTNLLHDLNKIDISTPQSGLRKGFHRVRSEPEPKQVCIEDFF